MLSYGIASLRPLLACNPLTAQAVCRASSTLAFQEVTAPTTSQSAQKEEPRTLLVAHGLLGSGRNWRSFIRRLVLAASEQHNSNWRALLVDLRNHGSSADLPGFHPPHSLETAAADVLHLVDHQLGGKMPDAIIGHSLGGKVALEFLQQASSQAQRQPPAQVWVLDSQPGIIPMSRGTADDGVANILNTIKDVPLPMPSRAWLHRYCKGRGISDATSTWLASNMQPLERDTSTEQFTWTFRIQGAAAMYNSYRTSSYWDLLAQPPARSRVHVVRAAQSDRWTEDMWRQLLECEGRSKQQGHSGRTLVHSVPDCGHWLHVDNPSGLLDLLLPYFTSSQDLHTC